MPFIALSVAPCATWNTEQEEETEEPEYGLDNEVCDVHECSPLIRLYVIGILWTSTQGTKN